MVMLGCYSDADLSTMTAVYKRAVQELKLERSSKAEHDRLAICILSLAHTYADPNRLLEKAVRNFVRGGRAVFSEKRGASRPSNRLYI